MKIRLPWPAVVATGALACALVLAATPNPASAAPSSWTHVSGSIRAGISYGDVGQAVRTLQGDLWDLGYNPGPVDGWFGDQTLAAWHAFERNHGVSPSYAIGRSGFAALLRAGGWGNGGNSAGNASSNHNGRTLHMVATAYSASAIDNYPYGAVDYYGSPLVFGTVAVDPRVIPMGSHMWISGYHSPDLPAGGFEAVARDQGGAIKGNRIDIFIDRPRSEVLQFGIQDVTVTLLN